MSMEKRMLVSTPNKSAGGFVTFSRWRRTPSFRLAAAVLALALVGLSATPVRAEVEWCEDGSPPANDFRLQPTGTASFRAPPYWLRSTDNGGALLTQYLTTGSLDVTKLSTLSGGVVTGMTHATTNRTGDSRADGKSDSKDDNPKKADKK